MNSPVTSMWRTPEEARPLLSSTLQASHTTP